MLRSVLCGVLVVVALVGVDGLKCWTCSTINFQDYPGCSAGEAQPRDCKDGKDVCQSFNGTKDGDFVEIKECAKKSDFHDAQCLFNAKYGGAKGDRCQCAGELCNTVDHDVGEPAETNPPSPTPNSTPPHSEPPAPTPPAPAQTENPSGPAGPDGPQGPNQPGEPQPEPSEPAEPAPTTAAAADNDDDPDGAFNSKPNFIAVCVLVPLSALLSRFALL